MVGSKTLKNYSTKLTPEGIAPTDDAFHGSPGRFGAEWWYFDAVFNNGYSLHIGCRTFSRKKWGMVSPFLEFYRNGFLEAKSVDRVFFRDFHTSSSFPFVQLSDKKIIDFDKERFKDSGKWVYDVSLDFGDNSADLIFVGTTKGWKIETLGAESWTVALPKAKVTGEIVVDGEKMSISGVGYHDHNWNYGLLTAMNYGKGWYWGKIMSKSLSVSWADIIRPNYKDDLLAVVNQDDNGFFAVKPEKIQFDTGGFVRIHDRKAPKNFSLRIDDVVNDVPVVVDVEMVARKIHYNRVLLVAPYWRYHVEAKGFIQLGSHKEEINPVQIMEFLRFS